MWPFKRRAKKSSLIISPYPPPVTVKIPEVIPPPPDPGIVVEEHDTTSWASRTGVHKVWEKLAGKSIDKQKEKDDGSGSDKKGR